MRDLRRLKRCVRSLRPSINDKKAPILEWVTGIKHHDPSEDEIEDTSFSDAIHKAVERLR